MLHYSRLEVLDAFVSGSISIQTGMIGFPAFQRPEPLLRIAANGLFDNCRHALGVGLQIRTQVRCSPHRYGRRGLDSQAPVLCADAGHGYHQAIAAQCEHGRRRGSGRLMAHETYLHALFLAAHVNHEAHAAALAEGFQHFTGSALFPDHFISETRPGMH